MSYRCVFHPAAENEYDEAYQWYEEQLQGLGDRFEEAIENSLAKICSKPFLYAKKRGVFREAKLIPSLIRLFIKSTRKKI